MINEALLHPKSIVVIGGSNNIHKPGGAVVRNLLNGGYDGTLRVHRSRCVAFIILSAGFGETTPEGDALEKSILESCERLIHMIIIPRIYLRGIFW